MIRANTCNIGIGSDCRAKQYINYNASQAPRDLSAIFGTHQNLIGMLPVSHRTAS
jgi:hypothetical protein